MSIKGNVPSKHNTQEELYFSAGQRTPLCLHGRGGWAVGGLGVCLDCCTHDWMDGWSLCMCILWSWRKIPTLGQHGIDFSLCMWAKGKWEKSYQYLLVMYKDFDNFCSVTLRNEDHTVFFFCLFFVTFSRLFISFPSSFPFLLRSFGLLRKFSFHFSGPDNSRVERIFRRTIWWSKEAVCSEGKRDILKCLCFSVLWLCYCLLFL